MRQTNRPRAEETKTMSKIFEDSKANALSKVVELAAKLPEKQVHIIIAQMQDLEASDRLIERANKIRARSSDILEEAVQGLVPETEADPRCPKVPDQRPLFAEEFTQAKVMPQPMSDEDTKAARSNALDSIWLNGFSLRALIKQAQLDMTDDGRPG